MYYRHLQNYLTDQRLVSSQCGQVSHWSEYYADRALRMNIEHNPFTMFKMFAPTLFVSEIVWCQTILLILTDKYLWNYVSAYSLSVKLTDPWVKYRVIINPRPAGGGGVWTPPPLRFFEDSKKTAARSAAGFSPTLSPIFSATFVKILTQCHVRSGHQVRSSDPTTK